MSCSRELEYRPMLPFGFDNSLSGKLPHRYSKPWRAFEYAILSCVHSYGQLDCFCKLRTDQKYKLVIVFLPSSFIRYLYAANDLWSRQSVLFLRCMVCVYGTVAAVGINNLVVDLEDVSNE